MGVAGSLYGADTEAQALDETRARYAADAMTEASADRAARGADEGLAEERGGTRAVPVLCAERLAIALEAGVPERRARELAAEDAQRCRQGRACICEGARRGGAAGGLGVTRRARRAARPPREEPPRVSWRRRAVPDPEPVELVPGHPWEGSEVSAYYVRWESSDGRVEWTWRVEAR